MIEWIDDWINEWTVEWMDTLIDIWINQLMNGWIKICPAVFANLSVSEFWTTTTFF